MAEDVQRITGTSAKVAARLCNFETGKAFLSAAHVEFLDTDVRGVIQGMQGPWVDLYGYASRIGDAAANMKLSQARIAVVKVRIENYANKINFQIYEPRGETQSGPNEQDNSGYYRAVEVYVYAHKPPSPTPPTPQPSLRRIVFRHFTKIEPETDIPGSGAPEIGKDAINDLLKLGLAAAQGKLFAEGLLGDETKSSRRISQIPSDHRVNKMIFDQEVSYDSFVGGSLRQTFTQLTYEWGPPLPKVTVVTRYRSMFNKVPNPPIDQSKAVPRAQAESTPLVVPPDL